MYDDEPGGSPTGASPRWDALAALEPALLDLERDLRSAACRSLRSMHFPTIDHLWHHGGFKNRMSRLVGWCARQPMLATCEAYETAYRHLWSVLETCDHYSPRIAS